MAISELMHTFAERDVLPLRPDSLPEDPAGVAWRLAFPSHLDDDFDGEVNVGKAPAETLLAPLRSWPGAAQLEALVIGCWDHYEKLYDSSSAAVAAALIAAAPLLPRLEALFIGDIPYELNEISWIKQIDLTPLLLAFPRLKAFGARGGDELRLSSLRHDALEHLELQAGGLSPHCVRDVTGAHLPALKRLDLWLGAADYGGDATLDDLAPIFSGKLFPALTHLGLMNTELSDDVAVALVGAPVMERLTHLDLSLGTMTDAGAEALLSIPGLKRLKHLNVSDNFLSDAMNRRLRAELPEVELFIGSDKEPHDDRRYVTHDE